MTSAAGSADPEAGLAAPALAVDAAAVASRDARAVSTAASVAAALGERAAERAVVAAEQVRLNMAEAVAAAAVTTADAATRAAVAAQADAAARAVARACAAVESLETIAAAPDRHRDRPARVREAADVAAVVAASVLAEARATANAAATVAQVVMLAAKDTARAAEAAAQDVRAAADAAVVASAATAASNACTAAAAAVVVGSTAQVEHLTARLHVLTALRESEERFSSSFDASRLGMLLVSDDGQDRGRILRVNDALSRITGHTEATLLSMRHRDLSYVDDLPTTSLELSALGDPDERIVRWSHATGRELWVRTRSHRAGAAMGPTSYLMIQVEDVTTWRQEDLVRQEQEARFRVAFDNAVTGMMFLDLDGHLRSANPALFSVLGYTPDDITGSHIGVLLSPDDREEVRSALDQLARSGITSYQSEHRFVRADRNVVWGALTGSLVKDQDGRPSYLAVQLTDITERRVDQQRIAHQALHDDLTDLPNRQLLHEHLTQCGARARRAGTHFAVLFLDLDDFKEVNDSLGHLVGDQVLIEVAGRLTGCLRGTDIAARFGGDEFVLLCEGLDDPAGAEAVLSRIDLALSESFTVEGHELRVSASIGVIADDGLGQPDDLLRAADTAMYGAKRAGKNRFETYRPEMRDEALRRVTIATELEQALERHELRLHYQPMYAVDTGRLVAVEALIRWQHPVRGLLAPADFLDVAEGGRLMLPIGDWVVVTAIAQAAAWQRRFAGRAPEMWVNISSPQLGRGRLLSLVERALGEYDLAPQHLGLELTERQLVGTATCVRDELLALHELGLRLAIDDFGTGYSSLEYLRRFPIDEIKIDKGFVGGLGKDRIDTALTSSIIALGQSLHLVVVAEGVETPAQYDALRDLGCTVAQGYFMHRPSDADGVSALLADETRLLQIPAQPGGIVQAGSAWPSSVAPACPSAADPRHA